MFFFSYLPFSDNAGLSFCCASQQESVDLWTKNYGQIIHSVTICFLRIMCKFSTQESDFLFFVGLFFVFVMFFELCKVMICHAMVNEVNQRIFLLVFLHYNVCASIFQLKEKCMCKFQ
jgi:hypothetical protein